MDVGTKGSGSMVNSVSVPPGLAAAGRQAAQAPAHVFEYAMRGSRIHRPAVLLHGGGMCPQLSLRLRTGPSVVVGWLVAH